ncbi:MAG TPA: zinc-binding alcohol dehydrogenase family protein [Puia sp.]|nr:zinc-binding alcohol dehydrogenase family protein [Puia sp.]
MKSLLCIEPGLLEYRTVAPPAVTAGHSILKIKRVGVCGTDLHAYQGNQPYFNYPRVLGHELAGDLVDIDQAPGFKPGDPVTILPYFHCGHCFACRSGRPNCCVNLQVCGVHIDGGMVDYLSVPSYSLVANQGLGYDELALIEPLAIGLHAVKRAGISPGEFVLVVGAGPIGLATMEFAALAGARLIVLDLNEHRLQFCRDQLHIEHIIHGNPSTVEDRLKEITRGEMPSIVIDATGNLRAINQAFLYLSHAGKYILVGLQKEMISFSHPEFHKREATLMSSRNATRQDFEQVMAYIRDGSVAPLKYITHRAAFDVAGPAFEHWLDPGSGVIKAMIDWAE